MCSHAGCKAIATSNSRCDKHPKIKKFKQYEHNKDLNGKIVHNTTRWKELRLRKLKANPLCEYCIARGFPVPAKDIDHIQEVQDRPDLAYTFSNLQALCRSCHNIKSAEVRKKRNKD